jgi:hypothetical protein
MLKRVLCFLLLFVAAQTTVIHAQPTVDGDFLKYQSNRFFVYLWKEIPPEKLNAPVGAADPVVAKLEEISQALEGYLDGVVSAMGLAYDVEQRGRIAVYVYANSEEYQQRTNCFLCAAHVTGVPSTPENLALVREKKLNPYAIYAHLDNTPAGPGGLTIGLPQNVLPHELTHVIDLSMIGGSKPGTLREGLAVYVAYKSDSFDDASQFALTTQHLQQFMLQYDANFIEGLLSGCGGLRRFMYNFGASFVDFLVQRSNIATFLNFYAALRPQQITSGPAGCTFGFPREALDALLRQHFGAGYAEIEQDYKQSLVQALITEEGRESFDFTMDQVYNKFLMVRSLLRDESSIEQVARGIWVQGGFNREKAHQLREYLNDPANYVATTEAIERTNKNIERLRSFVSSYRDGVTQSELQAQLTQLSSLIASGQYEAWRDLYLTTVSKLVTWRY